MMITLQCSYTAINGVAPREDQVEAMESCLADYANKHSGNLVAISEIRPYWNNNPMDESVWVFWLFRDYEEND